MSDKQIGWLGYNSSNNRMGILSNMDLWLDDGLHCGEFFEIFIDGEWKADRLELGDKWYLVYSKLSGNELEELKVRY